ncbi:MAG: transglutaminase domain-containing protein [Lachnospiraceae bacterium]|nr:transglutaminase domain-containing protein [Lachnospiraceae bacterium]
MLYDLLYALPMSIGLILTGSIFFRELDRGLPTGILIFTVCIISTLFIHLHNRGRIVLGCILAAALSGAVYAGHMKPDASLLPFLYTALLTVATFLLSKVAGRYFPVRITTALLFLAALILLMVFEYPVSRMNFAALFFYFFVTVAELIQRGWKKEGYTDRTKHIVFMLPFLLLPFILPILVKAPDKPYDWKFVKDIAKEVRIRYEVIVQTLLSDRGWDGTDNIGFSDKALLNGKVQGSPYTVMQVSADFDNDYRVYLSGKSFDTFTGREWIKTDDSEMDYRTFDRLEMSAAILSYDSDHIKDYIRAVPLHITYKGIRTSHLFLPARSAIDMRNTDANGVIRRDLVAQNAALYEQGGDWMLQGRKWADYTVRYMRINRDHKIFREMLAATEKSRQGRGVSEEAWDEAVDRYVPDESEAYSMDNYRAYRERMFDLYGKPVTVTKRTQDFLDDLLAGAADNMEKLERIEHYLSTQQYNRSPGQLPKRIRSEEDYLDYFLFEKPEGFCTHYATAFVLLSRAAGIPARFHQGYSILSRNRNFEVQSNRAHAWPEAYLDGAGWITFEPTPGYKRITGWAVTDEAGVLYQGYVLDPDDPDYASYALNPNDPLYTEYVGDTELTGDPFADTDVSVDLQDAGADREQRERAERMAAGRRFLKITLLLVPAFLALFLLTDLTGRRYRYRRMDDREKSLTLCRRNVRTLQLLGFRLQNGETLSEFRTRLTESVPDRFLSFIDTYERLLYAPVMQDGQASAAEHTSQAGAVLQVTQMEENSRALFRFACAALFKRVSRIGKTA